MSILGNPEAEARLEAAFWSAVEDTTAPDCPPDPTAACAHCGDELADHVNPDDPDGPVTPDVAVCLDTTMLARRVIRYLKFQLEPGQSLDCTDRTCCDVCGVDVCTEHSTEFASCSDTGVHHLACVSWCDRCQDVAREDALAEAADAVRKGGW